MYLLSAINPNLLVFVGIMMFTMILLYRSKNRLSQRTDSRENVQKNAQMKRDASFTGAVKPKAVANWEVEFFELTRQMTAQINTKMTALTTLIHDANRVSQRIEILVGRLDVLLKEEHSHETLLPKKAENPLEIRNPTIPPLSPSNSGLEPPQSLSVPANPAGDAFEFRDKAPQSDSPKVSRIAPIPDLGYSDDLQSLAALKVELFSEIEKEFPSLPEPLESHYKIPAKTSSSESLAPRWNATNPKSDSIDFDSLNRETLNPGTFSQRTLNRMNPEKTGDSNPENRPSKTLGELLLQEHNQIQTPKPREVPKNAPPFLRAANPQQVPREPESLFASPVSSGNAKPNRTASSRNESSLTNTRLQQVRMLANHGIPSGEIANQMNISREEVERILGFLRNSTNRAA